MFERCRYWRWRAASAIGRARRRLRIGCALLILLLVGDAFYVAGLWPDWEVWAEGPVFKSSFIRTYEHQRALHGGPRLRWTPVPLDEISPHLIRSVLIGEDSRFWSHPGFDRAAFEEAMEFNLSRRRLVYGGSTISQQTVKNLFLGPSRNPVRKWHELLLTLGMERALEKRRILEIYLNVAEFGKGVYGVEAASRVYWGVPARDLSRRQAAELAASLPAPRGHNPETRTDFFESRTEKLLRQIREL
ncbi:MAG: monofunctional biosynthetic peptidoglycan transglycosylase [Deltaproteobacteria bacterium]|jgi:monofunctional biosynthetic peptidoglycan transglycosylase|nr:monofunctional biosynthetic peptidoglycan transglycosylase [Deltaproteobacteria bacterium]